MPLPAPRLDDRTFEQLVQAAYAHVRQESREWNDLSPGDPGTVLIEAFAYMTDTMIYRLNRLPDRVYIALLRLLGVTLRPPAAAATRLMITRDANVTEAVHIPRGTRITTDDSGDEQAPIFITAQDVTLKAGDTQADVMVYHCEEVRAEAAGVGTGHPGQVLELNQPPIIAPTGDALDLVVCVEISEAEARDPLPMLRHEGKLYLIWDEVENFSNRTPQDTVYVADRQAGLIYFAPALHERTTEGHLTQTNRLMAAVPAADREIRVWYRRGGGMGGNVRADTLTKFKDPVRGVSITNPGAATGGRPAETLANALRRGPRELHSVERAVTARDYELIALRTPTISRARAFTQAEHWTYAMPGTVEVLTVPYVPPAAYAETHLSVQHLRDRETDTALEAIRRTLDERRPLGTTCMVRWTQYKTVSIEATVVIRQTEQSEAVREQALAQLYALVNPLPNEQIGREGWDFGGALRVSHVYDALLAEPGVRWVDDVRLRVDDVPQHINSLTADMTQPRTWYAADGRRVFRSSNDGGSWELVVTLDAPLQQVCSHPKLTGYVAAVTYNRENNESAVYLSRDCAATWTRRSSFGFEVESVAFGQRDNRAWLFLATDGGLFEVDVSPGAQTNPAPLTVDRRDPSKRFYAVTTAVDSEGRLNVMVAAQNREGVFLSIEGGRSETFRPLLDDERDGMTDQDVRVLSVQRIGDRLWLWAGTYSIGDDPGEGCFRWELRGNEDPPGGWERFSGWRGGSCRALAFAGRHVYAATHRASVMHLNPFSNNPDWQIPEVDSRLPVRDLERGRFLPVQTVAIDPDSNWLMAGVMVNADADDSDSNGRGPGVYRAPVTDDDFSAWRFDHVSASEFQDRVSLPPTWLPVSGEHTVHVETRYE